MIHEVTGDILLSGAAAIAHGVAPNDHFDQGLALALRERWPSMAKDYRHWSHDRHEKPGAIWAWAGADGKRIVSLLTRDGEPGKTTKPGRARIEYVNHALKALHQYCVSEKITSLALPRLGTGLGALEWADVKPLITHHLGQLGIPVYVYSTYRRGEKAVEPS